MNRAYILWSTAALLIVLAIGCSQTNPVGNYTYVSEINIGTKTITVKSNDKLSLNSNGSYTVTTSTQTWSGSYTLKGDKIAFSPSLDGSSGVTKGIIKNGSINLVKIGMATAPGKFVKQ